MEQQLAERDTTLRLDAVTALARGLLGGLPHDPGDPPPPSPIDPVIRWMTPSDLFGPVPEPWGTAFVLAARRFPALWDLIGPVGLNPQPLPPRPAMVAAIARGAAMRAELIGDAAGRPEAGGRYLADLVDWWCGTPPPPFPWPFPGPRPNWLDAPIGAADHLVFAGVLDAALATGLHGALGEGVASARDQLGATAMRQLG